MPSLPALLFLLSLCAAFFACPQSRAAAQVPAAFCSSAGQGAAGPQSGNLAVPGDDAAAGSRLVASKAALSLLLLMPSRAAESARLEGIDAKERSALLARAVEEREALNDLYAATLPVVNDAERSLAEKRRAVAAMGYNRRVGEILAKSRESAALILGGNPGRFFSWISRAWAGEREKAAAYARQGGRRRSGRRTGGRLAYTVFATQYFGETNYEVALPDKYLKFANRGWSHHSGYEGSDYSVKLDRSGWTIPSVIVWDVGPWNIDDNYWNPAGSGPRPRRMFTDLPQGMPEAEAAYYNNYNNGLDQYGRKVIVPSALDLTPAVAADIGLGYLENDWVTVTYLWEGGGGGEIVVDDSDPGCRLIGPSQYWWEVTGYGMNNQMHYTYNITTGWTCAAVWNFDAPAAGVYEISLFVPRNYATTTAARYYLNSGSGWSLGGIVNQSLYYDDWVSIGAHWLRKGNNKVALIDGTGEPSGTKMIGVDAVKIRQTD